MAENAIRRPGHRVRAHEQNGIAALLKRRDVTRPGITKDIFRARLQALRHEALETIGTARAMTVHHHDLAGTGCARSTHRRVHFVRVEFATLLIQCRSACDLLPGFDTRNAFHITKDNNAHNTSSLIYGHAVCALLLIVVHHLQWAYHTRGRVFS